jgi:hypothetical protein
LVMPKIQRHSSHIDMFFKCPVQFMFRYLMGIISIPTVALNVGSSTHYSIELNLKHKLETGELLPVDYVKEAARDCVNRRWEEQGIKLLPDEAAKGEKTIRGQAVDQAVALSTLHHTDIAPSIEPAAIEESWVLDVPNFPVDLAGQFDIREKVFRLRDTKTTAKTPKEVMAFHRPQLTVYSLAALKLYGQIPPLAVDYLVKTKEPKAITHTTICTTREIEVFARRWEQMELCIEKGIFTPSTPGVDWWCSPVRCGYWERCEYVA